MARNGTNGRFLFGRRRLDSYNSGQMKMEPSPRVTVVMPCHNGARTLEESIRSVLAQDFSDYELVVINDGSTDESSDLIQALATADGRIRVLHNDKASGAAAARNRGLQEARGRFIAFLDCDDVWLPGKLAVQLEAMQRHNAALVCSAYDVMDADGRITGSVRPRAGILTYRSLLGNNPVGCLTTVLDRSLCGDIRFDVSLPSSEDYQLWLSLFKRELTGICLPDTLGVYRVQGTTLSSNKFTAARNRWRVYREFERYNIVRSACCFSLYGITGVWKMLAMRSRRPARVQR